jgi:hypothetical protein
LTTFDVQLRTLIAAGELSLALERLVNFLKGGVAPDLLTEVLLQSSRLARITRDERNGLVTHDAATRERNRITAGVLEFIDELPARMALRGALPQTPPIDVPLALPGGARPPEGASSLEKIFGVNHLKRIAWLQQGLVAARSVCRIATPTGPGSGFLVAGGS